VANGLVRGWCQRCVQLEEGRGTPESGYELKPADGYVVDGGGRVRNDEIVRVGTWNLEGRWDARHLEFVLSLDCDVLLLTEVCSRVALPGYQLHATAGWMARGRHWAAVGSRTGLRPLPDPHGASAMVEIDGLRVCTSILPWRSCGGGTPWSGTSTGEKTVSAVAAIEASEPDVWGGDWNHGLSGTEYTGSGLGADRIRTATERLGLVVPTVGLPHRRSALSSIDHVAIPSSWDVALADRVSGVVDGVALSDHDAYIVMAAPTETRF